MKLHQAWTVTPITTFAGVLSMTACAAASSDVAGDDEHATTTGEAMRSQDQGVSLSRDTMSLSACAAIGGA